MRAAFNRRISVREMQKRERRNVKLNFRPWMIPATLMVIAVASCGPSSDDQTTVHVSAGRTDSTAVVVPTDTVVRNNTIVQNDTILKENTVVQQRTDTVVKRVPGKTTVVSIPVQEQRQIDRWLALHADSLNRFGDVKATVYAGG